MKKTEHDVNMKCTTIEEQFQQRKRERLVDCSMVCGEGGGQAVTGQAAGNNLTTASSCTLDTLVSLMRLDMV